MAVCGPCEILVGAFGENTRRLYFMPGNLANLFLQSAKKEGNLEEERRKQLPPAVLGVGAFVFRSSW